MKFIHIADIHFDMPFTILSRNHLAEERRIEQRNIFMKVIDYIKENNIDYLFIAGDLYENEYVRKSTIDFINNAFNQIPKTQIYITPGNHDPYLNNSYYNKYIWSENVHIFTNVNKLSYKDINIYGYGFTNFYSPKLELPSNIDTSKINILVTHADLDGASSRFEEYNPILKTELKNKNFDYIALGHIHKTNFSKEENIVYPGSLIAGGFDELGKHGMIVGEIEEDTKKVDLEFITLDTKEFVETKIDISDIFANEELIEKINNIKIDENKYYKIIFIGSKNIELDTRELLKYIKNKNILKIKDETKNIYNLEQIAKEQSLRGIFVSELLNQINDNNKEQILKSIEIGLNVM